MRRLSLKPACAVLALALVSAGAMCGEGAGVLENYRRIVESNPLDGTAFRKMCEVAERGRRHRGA